MDEATGEKGITELLALETALEELILDMIKLGKDKFALASIVTFLQGAVTKPAYTNAVKGYKEIIPEIKDLKAEEIGKLIVAMIIDIPKYIEAIKGKQA